MASQPVPPDEPPPASPEPLEPTAGPHAVLADADAEEVLLDMAEVESVEPTEDED